MVLSDFDNTRVSVPYTSSGLIEVLYSFAVNITGIIFLGDSNCKFTLIFTYSVPKVYVLPEMKLRKILDKVCSRITVDV
jgi:hypothetical protein